MANVLGELFQDIADAIRSKTGSTDTLKPNQFPAAIEGITTGGGGSSADVRYVTFRNESTGEECKKPVAYGDDCVDVVAKGLWKTPTKESTAQYNYTFYGWGASDGGAADANILKNITEDKTVYAIFTATVRYYTITWLDSDGVTELPGQKQWAYGTVPSYAPVNDSAVFEGWNPEPVAVTGDAVYVAKWLTTVGGNMTETMSWSIDDGVLTISGTGTMPTYTAETRPWADYVSSITSAVVEEGVTTLSPYAFQGCVNVESIILPGTLTSYNSTWFGNCTNLKELVMNAPGPNYLSSGMLNGLSSLEKLTLPWIGYQKNYAATNAREPLGYIFGTTAYEGATQTEQWKVYSSSSTSRVYNYIPNSLREVTVLSGMVSMAFRNCTNIKKVVLAEGVVDLGTETFWNSGIEEITIPNAVTMIGRVFLNCKNLTKVTIGTGVKTIYNTAFEGCTNLTEAIFLETSGWFIADKYNSTSGTSISVSSQWTAATYLKSTYVSKYFRRL